MVWKILLVLSIFIAAIAFSDDFPNVESSDCSICYAIFRVPHGESVISPDTGVNDALGYPSNDVGIIPAVFRLPTLDELEVRRLPVTGKKIGNPRYMPTRANRGFCGRHI